MDKLFKDPGVLARQARVVPSVKDGEHLGLKLYGIRDGSVPRLLGLNNGDMITAVNRIKFDSLQAVMEAYTKLSRSRRLVFAIVRKGKPITLTIRIR